VVLPFKPTLFFYLFSSLLLCLLNFFILLFNVVSNLLLNIRTHHILNHSLVPLQYQIYNWYMIHSLYSFHRKKCFQNWLITNVNTAFSISETNLLSRHAEVLRYSCLDLLECLIGAFQIYLKHGIVILHINVNTIFLGANSYATGISMKELKNKLTAQLFD
jgi:hypothetical protein